jgi:hypothetical protein
LPKVWDGLGEFGLSTSVGVGFIQTFVVLTYKTVMSLRPSFSVLALLLLITFTAPAVGSYHYTEKQLDALEKRVGRVFWISAVNDKLPAFLVSGRADATTFNPAASESFEIVELAGRKTKNPYYKVKFESGREGYIHVQAFHEQLNWTILTNDPLADEKRARAEQDEQEKIRIEWIQKQPWSAAVKEAATKRQAVPGMTSGEAKKVLGEPRRVSQSKGPQRITEEQWFYADGTVVIFRNGVLDRVNPSKR